MNACIQFTIIIISSKQYTSIAIQEPTVSQNIHNLSVVKQLLCKAEDGRGTKVTGKAGAVSLQKLSSMYN